MSYPERPSERDRWILQRRPPRRPVDPWTPYGRFTELERGPDGRLAEVLTLLLVNRECPFRCVMCDLWRHTLERTGPPGTIAAQIEGALARRVEGAPSAGSRRRRPRHLKLYNAGSFFDPKAIPPAEHPAIARLAAPFERVVVECHPAFVGPAVPRFRDLLAEAAGAAGHPAPALEVAMGLETAHPEVLARLNKRMTLEQFRAAAAFLQREGIDLRVFLLLRPPWLSEAEGVFWAQRSLEVAFECGASVCVLIPTRGGNGAMEALAAAGEWAPPALESLEAALEHGLALKAGRVFADLWDIERFARCSRCARRRIARLRRINRTQAPAPPVRCAACDPVLSPTHG